MAIGSIDRLVTAVMQLVSTHDFGATPMKSSADSLLVDIDEGARLLGVSARALRNRIARGQVPVERPRGGRRVYLRRASLLPSFIEGTSSPGKNRR